MYIAYLEPGITYFHSVLLWFQEALRVVKCALLSVQPSLRLSRTTSTCNAFSLFLTIRIENLSRRSQAFSTFINTNIVERLLHTICKKMCVPLS